MDEKFLSNKPIYDLNKESDLFGNLEKSQFISDFIYRNKSFIKKNNMIALFGNWGSGKTTLVNDIIKKIDWETFHPIVFDAWKYERDDNLAYSLYEYLLDEIQLENEQLEEAKKIGLAALRGSLKSIPLVEKVLNELEKSNKEAVNSLYKDIKNFEERFEKMINRYYEKGKKYLLVFIDELDRCDPENILNLLSSVKLLLTISDKDCMNKGESKIIYFCIVDKEAVRKSAKIRYGDNIKAEEYLEKIFDISFEMPKSYDSINFINSLSTFSEEEAKVIRSFLAYIHFDNPRHLKKVFNKYKLLCLAKNTTSEKYQNMIPSIIGSSKKGFIFDTIMVLYFIILYEFFYRNYLEVKNYDFKFNNYFDRFRTDRGSRISDNDINNRINQFLRANRNFFKFGNLISKSFLIEKDSSSKNLQKFISFFTPKINDVNQYLKINSIQGDCKYIEQFEYEGNEILIDFCKFIYYQLDKISKEQEASIEEYTNPDYNLFTLFDMVEIIL
jgi:energy-coupling factor transporter ATP-binding protein EcfA2